MNALSRFGALFFVLLAAPIATACEGPCTTCEQPACVADDSAPSWIFRRSTYTNDPETGVRVAQYMRIPPVEPLEDERNVTSRYMRSRSNLRGTQGSVDSYYTVQSWGNGRGGLDAEWERFHDAWKESYLQGGYSNGPAYGGGYGPWGYGNGYGYGPGYGYGYPGGGWGGPGGWGPPGPWPNNGGSGPNGNGGHNGGPNGGGHHNNNNGGHHDD
jgi:hypothetical protein